MKKIITIVAAICFAMSSFAETITCAKAVEIAMALDPGATTTDEYTVHGFITSTNGTVSRKQQVFWMADTQDGGQVFQAYWANLPEPYATDANPLPVGTELNLTGKLLNYNGTTAEIKNGAIKLINVPVVKYDTIDVTVEDAITVATTWNVGDISTDRYRVLGKVKAITRAYEENKDVPGYKGKSSFTLVTADEKVVFTAYNAYSIEEVFAGDSVIILGPLQYKAENSVEVAGGKVTITKKDHEEAKTITVTKDEAIETATAQEKGWLSTDNYIVTDITVDSISFKYDETKKTQSFYSFGLNRTADFIAYKCKVPRELVVGDKVTVKGKLQNFKGNAEIANGEVLLQTALTEVLDKTNNAVKVIQGGQIFIIKNGIRYNILGTQIH